MNFDDKLNEVLSRNLNSLLHDVVDEVVTPYVSYKMKRRFANRKEVIRTKTQTELVLID